jgi:iron complex outermembrane receptor protein
VNITQLSARDVNVNSRSATSSLATAQLAVVDGRSIYQDFFGFVMWDFMPANVNEIKQMEVIRGPASAVWGANALNGVINVVTKSPREMQGTYLMLGGGGFGRDIEGYPRAGGCSTWWHLRRGRNDRWAHTWPATRRTAFARPQASFRTAARRRILLSNTGTAQPKLDVG